MSEPLYEMRDVSTDEESLIELQKIEKHFGAVIALAGVSVAVHAGECHCLLGDNGAGKSTFIKTMSGVHKPTSGQILMGGVPVTFESPRAAMLAGIATVYQDLAMIPLMSVTRNFWMGREPTKGWGPFKYIDFKKANEVTMTGMADMGIRLREPNQAVGDAVRRRASDRRHRPRRLFRREDPDPGRTDVRVGCAADIQRPGHHQPRPQDRHRRRFHHAQRPPCHGGG